MRKLNGDDATRQWLEDMIANDVQSYDDNLAIVEAVGKGEILVACPTTITCIGSLRNRAKPSPPAIITSPMVVRMPCQCGGRCHRQHQRTRKSRQPLRQFLLSETAQQYFVDETVEYSLVVAGVTMNPLLKPRHELNPPQIDLSDLSDLQGTLRCWRT